MLDPFVRAPTRFPARPAPGTDALAGLVGR